MLLILVNFGLFWRLFFLFADWVFVRLKAKRGVPAIQKTDPKHLLGQGLAMTVDESFKEVYLPSKPINLLKFEITFLILTKSSYS